VRHPIKQPQIFMLISKPKMKIEKWGGARLNSGRKKKYGEDTKLITFRIPISHIEYVKNLVKKYLNTI
jgi:hypothetical protein